MPADRRHDRMRLLHASNASAAIAMARELQKNGEYDLFRGQRERWPIVPTLMRLEGDARDDGNARLRLFLQWAWNTQAVASMIGGEEEMQGALAVAQHYGLPTSLVDFTTDPAIAGFFARDGPAPTKPTESCIYCLKRSNLLERIEEMGRQHLRRGGTQNDLKLPVLVEIDVANLWRLQAQAGLFLHIPFTPAELADGWLEASFGMACIVFPAEGPVADPPRARVYPDRKSQLEVLLDEFFEREGWQASRTIFEEEGWTIIDGTRPPQAELFDALKPEIAAVMRLVAEKRHLEIFKGGRLPAPHASWNDDAVRPWLDRREERFGAKPAQTVELRFQKTDDLEDLDDRCVRQFADYLEQHPGAREHVIRWKPIDHKTRKPVTLSAQSVPALELQRSAASEWIDFAWDGMRLLPFGDEQVALTLGRTMASFIYDARRGRSIGDFARAFFGDTLSVELITDTKGDPTTLVSSQGLAMTLRPDFGELLIPEWRHLEDDVGLLLRVFGAPPFLTNFERWHRLFSSEILPLQISSAAGSDRNWLVFNPVEVMRLQPH